MLITENKTNQLTEQYITHNQSQTKNDQKPKKVKYKWVRKQQPLILYFITIVCSIYTTIEVIILLSLNIQVVPTGMEIVSWTSAVRIVIFLTNSFWMAGLWGTYYGYTMLDILGVLANCVSGMYISFGLSYTIPLNLATRPQTVSSLILTFLTYICYVGNFRVMMKTCIWTRWRVITMKIILYFFSFFYVAYGIYYQTYLSDYYEVCNTCDLTLGYCQPSCKKVTDCCFDIENVIAKTLKVVNSLILLFLSTALSFTSQLVAFMSDFDGAGEMEVHYTIGFDVQSNCVIEQQGSKVEQQDSKVEQSIQQRASKQQQLKKISSLHQYHK